eukprot:TRINITY_DN7460_c0_g1_i2.p1 TRINITY_DN7460_c0_g1~~TRINITY_DN7460_c0_g1_i2.p1  ORF type:complete len:164 (-),score=31.38 TRINITY_DN7460_c0_g1_i2:44-535(-)
MMGGTGMLTSDGESEKRECNSPAKHFLHLQNCSIRDQSQGCRTLNFTGAESKATETVKRPAVRWKSVKREREKPRIKLEPTRKRSQPKQRSKQRSRYSFPAVMNLLPSSNQKTIEPSRGHYSNSTGFTRCSSEGRGNAMTRSVDYFSSQVDLEECPPISPSQE